jgi:hypothetical protein
MKNKANYMGQVNIYAEGVLVKRSGFYFFKCEIQGSQVTNIMLVTYFVLWMKGVLMLFAQLKEGGVGIFSSILAEFIIAPNPLIIPWCFTMNTINNK